MTTTRPYQSRTIASARNAFAAGARSVCVVLPTGAGKTLCAGEMARMATERGRTTLWLVHRHELAEQARTRVPWADVRSIQGLLASGERPDAGLVVWDECHHAGDGAAQWHTLAEHYRSTPMVGLTATPERGDGTGLASTFDAMVAEAPYSELIRDGYLVGAEVWSGPWLERGEDAEPVGPWLERAQGLRTIVFARSVEHAEALAERWRSHGVRAAHVSGEQSTGARLAAVDAFRAGELDVLCNCQLLTEGFDVPDVACVVLARGFSHVGSYVQAVGRALRPSPGKQHALVLDLVSAWRDHGLPHWDRAYSLEGKPIRRMLGDDEVPPRMCRICGFVLDGLMLACPRCGEPMKRPLTRREKAVRLARVEAIHARQATAEARETWARLEGERRARGFAPGWAKIRFREKFGRWPSKAVMGGAG